MINNEKKLWAGRSSAELNSLAKRFNDSLPVDKELFKFDVLGSIAHAAMLGRQGIISDGEAAKLIDALTEMLENFHNGTLIIIGNEAEDVHSFIEQKLTEKLGDAGKKIHTARSRNDQVATAFKLFSADRLDDITASLTDVLIAVINLADENRNAVMPGYTHLQRAQPITFAHWILAYSSMFARDKERISDARRRLMSECPLGSGALAGTSFNINRKFTAEKLDFSAPSRNSLDGVSDRDFVVEILSALSLISIHLSRMSEEIILFSSSEFRFLNLSDEFSTGSSIMPQKKNPDISELIRGKTGGIFGSLMAMMTALKGLPLAYNKDLQEDKELLMGAFNTVDDCLKLTAPLLKSLSINKKRMRVACVDGFINATDAADYLAKKGLPFRDAYKIIGQIVAYCEKEELNLETVDINMYKSFSPLFENDIYSAVKIENCLNSRISEGGSSPQNIDAQIAQIREIIAN